MWVRLFSTWLQVSILTVHISKFFQSTFFTILIILSITISFRVIFYILAITTTAIISNSFSVFLTKSSLYIDYCSNFFSLVITFLMSLNRCFCFVSKNWNSRIFDGKNVIVPIVLSAVVSVSGAVTCIITSSIIRVLYPGLGYIEMGSETGPKVVSARLLTCWEKQNLEFQLINRIFFVFPIGSVICYVVLFYVLRKQNRQVLTKTSNRSKGEQKVFVQLLITTVLYGVSIFQNFWIFNNLNAYRSCQFYMKCLIWSTGRILHSNWLLFQYLVF